MPAIETTGLSSNQANTAIQTNRVDNQVNEKVSAEEQLHNELTKHYQHQPEHRKTLHDLTKSSRDLNRHLHSQYETKGKTVDITRTRKIDKALQQHKTPHSFHVYAGVKGSSAHNTLQHNITYHHAAYLHSSLNDKMAAGFTLHHHEQKNGEDHYHHHILKIHVPKGHPGSYVSHISHHPHEKEFILPRNTKLKIHNTTTKSSDIEGDKHHIHTHHATIEP